MAARGRADEHDLDELFGEYFGRSQLAELAVDARAAGLKRLQVDFAQEIEPGKRIDLWLVLFMVGAAPRVGASFTNKTDRATARTMAELLAVAGRLDATG